MRSLKLEGYAGLLWAERQDNAAVVHSHHSSACLQSSACGIVGRWLLEHQCAHHSRPAAANEEWSESRLPEVTLHNLAFLREEAQA